MKRTLIGLGLIASLMGGEVLAKGFTYPGKRHMIFNRTQLIFLLITTVTIQWVVSFLMSVKRVLLKLNPLKMLRHIIVGILGIKEFDNPH